MAKHTPSPEFGCQSLLRAWVWRIAIPNPAQAVTRFACYYQGRY